MAASFAVNITAKDGASGTLNSINARMAAFSKEVARTRAPFDQFATNMSKITGTVGLDKVAVGFQTVARHSLDAFRSVTRIVEPLAAITGAASVAGMYKLATAFADFGTALGNTAARAGLSAAQLNLLQNAGRLAGISAESVSSGMTSLRDNMVKATGGQAPQVIAMLQALGLRADDAGRFAKDTTKALPELADKIAALKDPTLQAQAATALFGGAGEALLPFLKRGSVGIAEYEEKARKYGVTNQAGVDAANKLREAQTGLVLAIEGLGNSIAEKVAPYIGPLVEQMASWVARNREWISQGIGDAVGKFATWLSSVDWASVGTSIASIYTNAQTVATALGGWIPVGEAILAFFAVAWLAKIMVPILAVGSALLRLPGQAAAAAAGAKTEMSKVGGSPAGGASGGFNMMKILGAAGAGYALYDAVKDGSTADDRHNANTQGPLAQAGMWLGSKLGMSFDENGHSKGLLDRWTGGGGGGSNTPLPAFSKATQGQWNTDLAQLQGKGWTKEQAAGILGNLDQESGGRHDISGDKGAAYGMAQWHGDRQANFAKQYGHDIKQSTHAEQVDFVDWELNNTEKGAGNRLRQANTVGDSAAAVRKYYERPLNATGQEDAWRTARADRIYAGAAGPSGPDRNLPQNAGTAANPGGAATAPVGGQIGVGVTFNNAPAGMQVATTQAGQALAPLKVQRSGVGAGGGFLGMP